MTDPVYEKLKADAAVVLIEMWRSIRHQTEDQNATHMRMKSELNDGQSAKTNEGRKGMRSDGLCYFHLN